MNRFAKQLLPFCSLIFIISLCTFLEPDNFLSARNLVNVLCRSSINGIMAAGMTYIIITGGIDLSVGSMLAVCGMIGAASMLYFSGGTWADISSGSYIHLKLGAMIAGTLVCVLAGAVCGFANGMLITKLKLAPFIVTLGTMSIFRGISYIMNAGKPFAVSDYSWLDTGRVAGIPSSVILLVIVMVAFWFLLKHTRFGRYTYAIGSNVQTAFHAGINVNNRIHDHRGPRQHGPAHRWHLARARHRRGLHHRRMRSLRRTRHHDGHRHRHAAHQLPPQRTHSARHLHERPARRDRPHHHRGRDRRPDRDPQKSHLIRVRQETR